MNDKKRNVGRVALYASVIGAMVISALPAAAGTAAAQGNTRKIGDFDVAGRFLEVWSAPGNDQANTYVNGLPITARRSEISTARKYSRKDLWANWKRPSSSSWARKTAVRTSSAAASVFRWS